MHKIIVGLTSTPPRINSITPTLLALANQKLKPDEIVLSIPKVSARFGVPYEITNPDILKLVANGTVIINVIDHDYGLTMATLQKNTPRLQDLELYNIRPQTNESLKTISKKERIQFLSDDFTISQFLKKNNIKMNVLNQDFCRKDKANNIKVLKLGLRAQTNKRCAYERRHQLA